MPAAGRNKRRSASRDEEEEEEDSREVSMSDEKDDDDDSEEDAPPRKRQRTQGKAEAAADDSSDDDVASSHRNVVPLNPEDLLVPGTDLRRGSIVAVRMKNFMTYSNCEIYPGPGMNVVIGPNGTGKSSIVSAIAIALGAKLKVLDRAKNFTNFILRGERSGFAEVELAGGYRPKVRTGASQQQAPEQNLKIRCTINMDGTKSFTINDRQSTHKEVQERVHDLNIHLDNLCQFLPQERVAAFAQLTPEKLLEETEKAAGPKGMHETHMSLIQSREEHSQLQSAVRTAASQVQRLQDQQRPMQADVSRWRERKELMGKVEELRQGRPWMLFEEKRLEAINLKQRYKAAEAELEEYQRGSVAAFQDEEKKAEARLHACERELHQTNQAQDVLLKEHQKLSAQLEKMEDEEMVLQEKIEQAVQDEDSNAKALDRFKKKIVSNKRELDKANSADAPSHEQMQELREELDVKSKSISQAKLAAQRAEREFRLIEGQSQNNRLRLQQLKDPALQAFERLKQMSARRDDRGKNPVEPAVRLREIIDQQADMFKKKIYGPLCLEIAPTSDDAASLVDRALDQKSKLLFLAEDKADEKLLLDIVDREKLMVSISCSAGISEPEGNHKFLPKFRLFGIDKFVSDLFSAPAPVKAYLCHAKGLHLIGVGVDGLIDHAPGSRSAGDCATELAQAGMQTWFAGSIQDVTKFMAVTSKYGAREISFRTQNFGGPRPDALVTGAGASQEDFRKRQQEYRQESIEIQQTMKEKERNLREAKSASDALQHEKEGIQNRLAELTTSISKIAHLNRELKESQAELARHETEQVEIAQTLKRLRSDFEKVNGRRASKANALGVSCLEAIQSPHVDRALQLQLEVSRLKAIIFSLQFRQRFIQAEGEKLESRVEECKLAYTQAIPQLRALKREANESCGVDWSLPDWFPESVADLDSEVHALERKCEMLLQSMAAVAGDDAAADEMVRSFERRQKELEESQERLVRDQRKLRKLTARMTADRAGWVRDVVDMCGQISAHLSAYFQSFGCSAEAHLRSADGERITSEVVERLKMEADKANQILQPEEEEADAERPADDGAPLSDAVFDFQNYAIDLMVSFRAGQPMVVLRGQTQSGGEKSVSTMLYLISLQQLSHSPFRLVDEINQGMDPHNERLVFELLSKAARGMVGANAFKRNAAPTVRARGMPQYFLITPKLLPDLPFTEDMTVLCVLNGPAMIDSEAWNENFDKLKHRLP